MSRIGKLPIAIPAGVTVEFNNGVATVKGANTLKYNDKNVESGKTYKYTVKAINQKNNLKGE